eukprot:5143664-Lingulodinium_polyedra.AAC.1
MPHGNDDGGRCNRVLVPLVWMIFGGRCSVLMEWLAARGFATNGVQQFGRWLRENTIRNNTDLRQRIRPMHTPRGPWDGASAA